MKECILSVLFMFAMTSIGACLVVFFKEVKPKLNMILIGVASGIMIASSVFSLIIPSLGMCDYLGAWFWLPTSIGLIFGGAFLLVLDKIAMGLRKTKLNKSNKLFFAMTFHNIPEGLAVGVGFGAYFASNDPLLLASAIGLAIGIGVQNLPEGFAVSLPLYVNGYSKRKSAFLGVVSGAVEPVFALLGVVLAVASTGLLPWLLSLSAGCMLIVTISELIPELKSTTIGSVSFLVGFILMLILDNTKF